METVSDGCPTGVLIDIDLQSKGFNNSTKENERIRESIKNKEEKIIAADTKSLHPWTSNCFLDQSPPRPTPTLQTNFFTPKSKWKTPSPKSMKIISREASRIVDQLYSSPINCSEAMIYDEVFPAVKSLDDVCLDEFHIKSKILSTTDMTFIHERVDQSNPDSLDLTKCTISAVSSCTSKEFVSDEKLSSIALQSDIKPTVELDSISGNAVKTMAPENASNPKLDVEPYAGDKDKVKCDVYAVNSSSAIPENVSSDQFLAHEHEVAVPKKIPSVAKGFGFKMSLEHSEKNKENIPISNQARQAKYESCSSIENGPIETKIGKKILRKESIAEKSSKKNIIAKYSVSEKKKAKENQNLEDSFSKKPKSFLQNYNAVPSQSLLYKRDPLCKTGPLLETPVVSSSVRRIHSFHEGSSRNAFPLERKFMPTMNPCSRVLKPKMSFNQVSNNGNGLSTPLQFGKFKPSNSYAANPMRRKSLLFNSNYSLVASDIKVAAQNDQHSSIKKPAVTSSKLGLTKKLNIPSSHPKFKNDNLPRKLFP